MTSLRKTKVRQKRVQGDAREDEHHFDEREGDIPALLPKRDLGILNKLIRKGEGSDTGERGLERR